MQKSKHRSNDTGLPESRLDRDILEQITRPSARTVDSPLDFDGVEDTPHPQTRPVEAPRPMGRLTDPIPGLADLPTLLSRMDKALTRRHEADGDVLAFHIELNNFNYVQDQLGEATAKAVLTEISNRLLSHLRNEDTVARVGQSELIVGVSLHGDAAIALLTDRLRDVFQNPIVLRDREVHVWATFSSVEAERFESAVDVLARLDEVIGVRSPGRSTTWSRSLEERRASS